MNPAIGIDWYFFALCYHLFSGIAAKLKALQNVTSSFIQIMCGSEWHLSTGKLG